MVFILHRYILRELLKVFILTTVALTLILSLGSILQPIQEYGVGPVQVLHLLIYSIPITLTFVLPIAALFAAALVYGRIAGDNELDACRASGISLFTLMYPGLALAIVVTIVNLIMSFHTVPVYVHKAEEHIKTDAKQILFRNIQRKGYYELESDDGAYRIFADYADNENDILSGVIVTEVQGGRITRKIIAESAKITFASSPGKALHQVQILTMNLYKMGDEEEGWGYLERFAVTDEFPSMLQDNISFKKIQEMRAIQADPLLFGEVDKEARDAYQQLVIELLAKDINSKVAGDVNNMYEVIGATSSVKFSAKQVAANTNPKDKEMRVRLLGRVNILEYDSDTKETIRTLSCQEGALRLEGDEFAPTLKMELISPHWKKADGSAGHAVGREYVKGLILPGSVNDHLKSDDVLSVVSPVSVEKILAGNQSSKLVSFQYGLQRQMNKVFTAITAEIHTRLVFGIGCVPLIVIGIVLGINYRGGHMLIAFGVSVIPAGLLLVSIMMGKNLAKNQTGVTNGILVMWLSFAGVLIAACWLLRKLLRN